MMTVEQHLQRESYFRWLDAGQPEGRDIEFWLSAEFEWHANVSLLAHELWELYDMPEGQDVRFWHDAEVIALSIKKLEGKVGLRQMTDRRFEIVERCNEIALTAIQKEKDERVFNYLRDRSSPWWRRLWTKLGSMFSR